MNLSRPIASVFASALLVVTAAAAEPSPTQSPTVSPTASPGTSATPATIGQSVTQLSAQRAAAERWRIYRAGKAYSSWLDQLSANSHSQFLQRIVFERVTWMRLITALATFALVALLAAWFLWFVRRRAGEIQ